MEGIHSVLHGSPVNSVYRVMMQKLNINLTKLRYNHTERLGGREDALGRQMRLGGEEQQKEEIDP